MARLTIALLGTFQVFLDGCAVRALHSPVLRGLLSYLALEPHREHARRSLADLFWPEQPDRVAISNLRYALSDLRRAVGDTGGNGGGQAGDGLRAPLLQVTRDAVSFNLEANCWIDVREFERLTDAPACGEGAEGRCERLQAAAHLYRGPLLEGFGYPRSSAFEDWIFWNREQYQAIMREVLHQLVLCHEIAGRCDAAHRVARQWVQLEPLDEEAHRQLMLTLSACGQRNAALAHYERWRVTLAHELNAEPMAETTALYEALRSGELPHARAAEQMCPPTTSHPTP